MVRLERPTLERRVLAALEASPPRIPVLIGADGSGRTSLLLRLRDQLGDHACQYVDVQGIATTPERFLATLTQRSPFARKRADALPEGAKPRDAFEATLEFLTAARAADGDTATFLLDEALELRTFESFPGLRSVLRDLVSALSGGTNHFVLATRYATRAHRLLRDAPAEFELIPVFPLTPTEVGIAMSGFQIPLSDEDPEELAQIVQSLAFGHPAYVSAILSGMRGAGVGAADPVSALAALMAPGERLFSLCRYQFEMRLHRARGYGALKAILSVLADEEPLTLTEIALRLRRTPGSTKDYLSWLEDVDLISVQRKRYRISDPLLRVWVRLHCRAFPPSEDEIAREVQIYALSQLPQTVRTRTSVGADPPADNSSRAWGMIEID